MELDDLEHWPISLVDGFDFEKLRHQAWGVEGVVKALNGEDSFRSLPGILANFDSVEGGITLVPYEETAKCRDQLSAVLTEQAYGIIRKLCISFNQQVLGPMGQIEGLVNSYLLYGFETPREASFFDSEAGFFLRPGNVMNFLCRKNTGGGVVELFFKYNDDTGRSRYRTVMLTFDPAEKVVEVEKYHSQS